MFVVFSGRDAAKVSQVLSVGVFDKPMTTFFIISKGKFPLY